MLRAHRALTRLLAAAAGLVVLAAATTTGTAPASATSATSDTAGLTCSAGVAGATRQPVLLVPGTTFTAATNFDWNYERALTQRGIPWCAVDLPPNGMGDTVVAAERVRDAIRSVAVTSRQQVDVVGYSQGGMLPRWALKYFPDTRALVDDVVGIDPSNHGTLDSQVICQASCPPAFWQQRTGSDFLRALNTGPETWAGIDYTVVYTLTDQVVVPNLPPAASSELHTGDGRIANVPVQRICPVHLADHLSMGTTDPVGWAVVLDALQHDGPASAARVPLTTCAQDVMPGVDRTRLAANIARTTAQITTAVATSPQTTSEPPLPAYAR
jgi:pimeloyl-ACP methyl ester carboxylesterase